MGFSSFIFSGSTSEIPDPKSHRAVRKPREAELSAQAKFGPESFAGDPGLPGLFSGPRHLPFLNYRSGSSEITQTFPEA